MGAILINNRSDSSFLSARSLDFLSGQFPSGPMKFESGSWDIYYFPKKLSGTRPQIINQSDLMIVCGTAIVPGKTSGESLQEIYKSLHAFRKLPEKILGNYFILFKTKGSLIFFSDPLNLYSIYLSRDKTAVSSSFLALAEGLEKLALNRNALTENIVTGAVTGTETLFNEILRLNNDLAFESDGLKFTPTPVGYSEIPEFRTREDSRRSLMRILDGYFTSLIPIAAECGIDTGLTGGYDSRLMLVLALKHFSGSNIQIHSHFRKKYNLDLVIAEKIAHETELPLQTIPVKDLSDSSLEEIMSVLGKSMLFCDGQIRTNSYWYEEYNTEDYRRNILQDKRLGFHGVGGEIFRNQERSWLIKPELADWIKYTIVRRYAGNIFYDHSEEEKLTEYILNKLYLFSETGFHDNKRISPVLRKIYMNHVYMQAGRGLRQNSENRLAFFLCPFADPSLLIAALGAVPWHGISMNFESELIKLINPKVSAISSSYGYNFINGEPLHRYLPMFLAENFLPSVLLNRLKVSHTQKNDFKASCSDPRVSGYFNYLAGKVKELNLPVDIDKLLTRSDLAHLVISAGFLIERFNEKTG